ncbi:MAG TPA: hypothetical protein DCP20_01475 [Coriobacteriia bacterium]|nr:MAG: hypothetical protein XD74_0369 [Actinobacteria bacterium 66_15]HAL29375.1 hypothetical protein [Coriobacteriia bacterium]
MVSDPQGATRVAAVYDRESANRAKALLVDPASQTVVWASWTDVEPGSHVASAVPMAEEMGVAEAVQAVAVTGIATSRSADLIPTRRGSMALVVSFHRLPDGAVLVLMENAWQHAGRSRPPGGTPPHIA